jgi:hypothetical protein
MGIFGSITPTSDIDIGIQYSGNTLKIPALAYIVSRFENLFLIFTNKSSLNYDIETYADMMTLPNPNSSDTQHPDYFYLDSSNFTDVQFKKMLVCAGKSIARNFFLAQMYLNESRDMNIPFSDIMQMPDFRSFTTDVGKTSVTDILMKDNTWFDEAKNDVNKFLNMSYDAGREEYYRRVDSAEKLKFEKTNNSSNLNNLSNEEICQLMVAIGDALTYRMESYICAPTIVHVVRILQASKAMASKYKTVTPKIFCKGISVIQHLNEHVEPYCTIGYYGFMLSILEQIGYLYRFYLEYCKEGEHQNLEKCEKKKKKYMDRYKDGFLHLNQLKDSVGGGKKRRTRRRFPNKKRKATKRRVKRRSATKYKRRRP